MVSLNHNHVAVDVNVNVDVMLSLIWLYLSLALIMSAWRSAFSSALIIMQCVNFNLIQQ